MKIFAKTFLALSFIMIMTTTAFSQQNKQELDLENTLYLDLEWGRVVIRMLPEVAPKHVAQIKELTREGFYDGLVFHRVIDGFMAQTGHPNGHIPMFDGESGSGKKLDAEFSDTPHYRGMVSMARLGSDINSASSQFFITLVYASHLDGQYTVWGEVVKGMSHVDKIKKGVVNEGTLDEPTKIVRMQVAADVKE